MSNMRIPDPRGVPQGPPTHRPGEPPAQSAPPPLAQPTTQPTLQSPPPRPRGPQRPSTGGVRRPQPGNLPPVGHSVRGPQQTVDTPQPGNARPGQPLQPPQQPPVGYAQPYPNGGPGTMQPYAPPYRAATQPSRGMRYLKSALIGAGLFSIIPSLELVSALSNTGGLGAGTILGFGLPVLLRFSLFGAGIGAATRAVRERRAARQQQQGMQMQQMQPYGGAPPGYAPPPQQPWGNPQGYQGNAGAPTSWPVPPQWQAPPQQPWPQQYGGPVAQQPPVAGQPSGTFGPPDASYQRPAQPPAPQARASTFGPPPTSAAGPALHPQQTGVVSSPAAPKPNDRPLGQPASTAQSAYPNNSAGATTPAQILERFSPERRKGVFDQLVLGMQNYPGPRSQGFADIAQAIPLLADNAPTAGGRFDEKLAAFRTLYAQKKNVSPDGARKLHEALRKVFGSLTPGAQSAFLRDNKDADFVKPQAT
jgi:hypothetical protein